MEDAAFSKLQDLSPDLRLKDLIHLLNESGDCKKIAETLSTFSARLVLTAHPTQFYPQAVLEIISKLRTHIAGNDINDIDITLQQLGMTSLLNAKKPTPFQEAQNLIYYLKYVYYDAIGDLYTEIKKNMHNCQFENYDLLKLGFWPGGDRDGNPYVTSDLTMDVANDLRMSLMKCYYWELKQLALKLTFKQVDQIINDLKAQIYELTYSPDQTISFKEILDPLLEIKSLVINHHKHLYLDELQSLIDKVNIFKTHFVSLDIRQNHPVHQETIKAILKKNTLIINELSELSRERFIELLLHQDLAVNPDEYEDSLVKDTIDSITSMRRIQEMNGEDGCNRYVISNSEDVFSVLYVFALMRWCAWGRDPITADIIPLFETMRGMETSGDVMTELLSLPQYRAHVEQRRDRQTMMLGFSDGTKDGGYLQANWSIFKTKEVLSDVCEKAGVKAIFFDGRGGPPARGGGKTYRFYASQSNKTSKHEIQLTIQGQTITSRYGTKEHFTFNYEQLLTAGLSNRILGRDNMIDAKQRSLIESLARVSYEKYQALKMHPLFLPYLENKSTLKYYSAANIGSRPDRRQSQKKMTLDDLRAIPFVGSWSQMKQNVPGYYGIGTALKTLVDKGHKKELKHLFGKVPFFKALILNSMMSLFKCYFELTAYFEKDETFAAFWKMLSDEYELSVEMCLLVSGYDLLMEEEPATRESIEIRKQIVLPLLLAQQAALQKIEAGSSYQRSYEKMVMRSLYGNINASRNSA